MRAEAINCMASWAQELQASWESRVPVNIGVPGIVPCPLGTGGALVIQNTLAVSPTTLGYSLTLVISEPRT